jgi:hypothetical protein
MSAEAAGANSPRAPRRTDRRDPRLPLADMFDPVIAQRLWESLPEECRVDHIDKKNIPEIYRNALRFRSAGGPWTTCYINIRELPETMVWEFAWLLHREIELGRFVDPLTVVPQPGCYGSRHNMVPSVGDAHSRCSTSQGMGPRSPHGSDARNRLWHKD